jgi:hypothetical protein
LETGNEYGTKPRVSDHYINQRVEFAHFKQIQPSD